MNVFQNQDILGEILQFLDVEDIESLQSTNRNIRLLFLNLNDFWCNLLKRRTKMICSSEVASRQIVSGISFFEQGYQCKNKHKAFALFAQARSFLINHTAEFPQLHFYIAFIGFHSKNLTAVSQIEMSLKSLLKMFERPEVLNLTLNYLEKCCALLVCCAAEAKKIYDNITKNIPNLRVAHRAIGAITLFRSEYDDQIKSMVRYLSGAGSTRISCINQELDSQDYKSSEVSL